MKDPLGNFDWSTLYKIYDASSNRFDGNAKYISNTFKPRPKEDRELYYMLIEKIDLERRDNAGISLDTYEAMLYWKLCSQPAAVKNVCEKISNNQNNLRYVLNQKLIYLTKELPDKLQKDVDRVIIHVKKISKHRIFGMGCGLPVNTTFLHFLYPDIVPIFDKMVLSAVGISDKNANQRIDVLEQYIPFAWELAEKYSSQLRSFKETPLRLIDMALWAVRGNT